MAVAGALLLAIVAALMVTADVARSQEALPTGAELAAMAARRFPQPVRVGDLIHRKVIQPLESHRRLGRVAAIVRSGDGHTDAVLDFCGFLVVHWFSGM